MRRICGALLGVLVAMGPIQASADGPRDVPLWLVTAASVSAGLTLAATGAAVGTTLHRRTRLAAQLRGAIRDSHTDLTPDNDIASDSIDPCRDARMSPLGDTRVTNAAVTKVCNRIDASRASATASGVFAGVGLLSTAVFTGMLLAWDRRRAPQRERRTQVHVGASTTAATFSLVGRF